MVDTTIGRFRVRRASLGDIDALNRDQVTVDRINHPEPTDAQTVIVTSVERLWRIWVRRQRGHRRADPAHPILIIHIAPRRSPRRRRPLDLHWPLSNSAIASSCETAPGLPAATHSR